MTQGQKSLRMDGLAPPAADKFKQALDRVHRLNSVRPVNIYVVLCQGTIDRRLESLTDEKTDAAELVLDGRLLGERSEEVTSPNCSKSPNENSMPMITPLTKPCSKASGPDSETASAKACASGTG